MNKIIIIWLLIACPFFAFSQSDMIIKERIIKDGDPDYRIIEKQKYYYSQEKELIKVENYYTKEKIESSGVIVQIDYFENNIANCFEMIYAQNGIIETGCKTIREFVNDKDELVKIEVNLEDNSSYVFIGSSIKVYDKFRMSSLFVYDKSIEALPSDDRTYAIETPLFKGIAHVTIIENNIDVTTFEKYLISKWCDLHGITNVEDIYNYKIKVRERDKEYFILMQDNVAKTLDIGDIILLYYYYIGAINTGTVYLGIDYFSM